MHIKASGRCLLAALALATSTSAYARTPPLAREAVSTLAEGVKTGRTHNGRTYTDAPVEVKLGPNTFRIPANYLDSQIAPWPGEGVTLVIEWPDMVATEPGARAHPRTNDFLKEISALVDFVDRVPIETLLGRFTSNEAVTEPDSVMRGDPRTRLDLRVAQPESMGLTPYATDEAKMGAFQEAYAARYGAAAIRNPRMEKEWYVARTPDGSLATFIKCDSRAFRPDDGLRVDGDDLVPTNSPTIAGCVHYITDDENKLSFSISYHRVFLKDWKRIEDAFREVILRTKVNDY